ncbi:MAG: TetR/AcrR family transcriptional regulator [Acidithiobacillales bacterium]
MGQRAVGRPRDGNPAETRREILRAAEESFAAAGFAGATTRQVAAKAGVNVATLHYHFGNKEGLYRAVLEEAISGRLPAPEPTGPPSDRLARLVGQLWDFGESHPALARLSLFDRLGGPRTPAGAVGGTEDARVALLSRAISGMGNGGVPPALEADVAARVIVTLVDGAHLAAREASGREASVVSRDAVVAAALRICLGGAAPPPR